MISVAYVCNRKFIFAYPYAKGYGSRSYMKVIGSRSRS